MTRWKAAGLHLSVSMLIVGTIATLIFVLWFPHGLFRIAGLDKLLITMMGVDIAIGPLLTCIVYKAGKPSLKRDLTVIGVLQAAFLAYGLNTAWITRPVFVVWSVDRMSLIFANEIEAKHLSAAATTENHSLPWFGPRLVAVTLPKDINEREETFISIIRSGTTVERMPAYYAPYSSALQQVLRNAAPLDRWMGTESKFSPQLISAIASTGLPASGLRAAPIESSRDAAVMLIDGKTAMPLKVVPRAALSSPAAATP